MAEVQKLTKQVKKNYKWIVKDTNLVELLDGMFQEDIFNDNDRELVKREPTTDDQNRKFLDILFKKNKQNALIVFLDELKDAKREDVVTRITETQVEDKEIEQGASGNSWQVTSYGVTPNPKLDDKFMLKVANSFSPSSLDIVATSLGLSKADVDHARMANQYSPITQSHNILVKWRNKNSLHSNVLDRLLKGLEEAYDSGADIDQDKLLKCVNDLKQ
ncbi:hypothetical protein KUTeg_020485 [Tegillarca granosa]|uniref:Death domain-containing protein n=1 Tax=Tegillarca granosa TaxID=220873 RepID=A0ABQ9EE11_TEGGR|nr:hypothetical protein KUTeg_020485 [Tegillarca granosa]